jgi:tripartite-type tricarboxylate transporter receptor subunit TctC
MRDRAGRLRVIGISAPEWLAPPFDTSPTWREQGIVCVIGAWRGVTAPAGIDPAAVAFWKTLLTAVTSQPSWQTELAARSWSPMYLIGSEVQAYLPEEAAGMTAISPRTRTAAGAQDPRRTPITRKYRVQLRTAMLTTKELFM